MGTPGVSVALTLSLSKRGRVAQGWSALEPLAL